MCTKRNNKIEIAQYASVASVLLYQKLTYFDKNLENNNEPNISFGF